MKNDENKEAIRLRAIENLRQAREKLNALPEEEKLRIRQAAGKIGSETRNRGFARKDEILLLAMATGEEVKAQDIKKFPGINPSVFGSTRNWTKGEIFAVARKGAQLMVEQGLCLVPEFGVPSPAKALMFDCLREAQCQVLPSHRRRLGSTAKVSFSPLFWNLLAKGLGHYQFRRDQERRAKAEASAVPPAPRTPSLPLNGATPQPPDPAPSAGAAMAPLPASGPHPLDSFLDARIKALLSPLQEMVIEELDRVQKEIAELRAQLAKAVGQTAYVAPEKIKAPSVGIFGALPDQFSAIEQLAKEAGLDLDLRYFPKDQARPVINCQWAVQMRFVQHATGEQIKQSGIPPSQVAFIGGGLTSVIRQLEAWFKHD